VLKSEEENAADLLVVRGDPLLDIHALSSPVWVIHGGEVIRSPGGKLRAS
jgi:imidazolonepropionase-like amidohydrolase